MKNYQITWSDGNEAQINANTAKEARKIANFLKRTHGYKGRLGNCFVIKP